MCFADLLTLAKEILKGTSFSCAFTDSCVELILGIYQCNIRQRSHIFYAYLSTTTRLLVHHDILLHNSYSLIALLRNLRFQHHFNKYLNICSSRPLHLYQNNGRRFFKFKFFLKRSILTSKKIRLNNDIDIAVCSH